MTGSAAEWKYLDRIHNNWVHSWW